MVDENTRFSPDPSPGDPGSGTAPGAATAGERPLFEIPRQLEPRGDRYGTHRAVEPPGSLPQPAWRLDNDFTRLFRGEVLIAVDTLNVDAASFAQIEQAVRDEAGPTATDACVDDAIAHTVLRTVTARGKQHNPVTGSGGMLLGRILQLAPECDPHPAPSPAIAGDRIATLVSLSLTPLRLDRVCGVRRSSAQIDVVGEAVLFAAAPFAVLPADLPERLALAALDVAGAAPQVARLVRPGHVVVILGAGGKSGILCAVEARRTGGPSCRVVGVEARPQAADELRALGVCDAVIAADARDPVSVRRAVLGVTGGREADVALSCVNVPDAEMAAVLATRDRGTAYFFAMSTSFTKAALGAEGVGKDIDLVIGNGYAAGHAAHTLAILREFPAVRALFEKRYL
jgi:L-erythro-3,5-diaminohexanoate dehydrogenase